MSVVMWVVAAVLAALVAGYAVKRGGHGVGQDIVRAGGHLSTRAW